MLPTQTGSFRLFRVAGISVYLHWSWLLVPYVLVALRLFGEGISLNALIWGSLACFALFVIVLLHEFGHALACRSVGGIADSIVLWPLGGIAYVVPPPRPGPTLWSLAAGPLVNLLVVPLSLLALFLVTAWKEEWPEVYRFVSVITLANVLQLFFNLLPIYPLDGGQILQSILWFLLGRGRSLLIVSGIGVLGAAGLLAFAVREYRGGNDFAWVLMVVAAFICLRSLVGFQQARFMLDRLHLPRHSHASCPACGEPLLEGEYWLCDQCGNFFDMFARRGVCPHCEKRFEEVSCPDCRWRHPLSEWEKVAGEAPKEEVGGSA